uniref:PEBP family protein n=1 Tax=uncultured marine thaumarchaeote KM3_73_B11 TaxID=1456265 RepID=A0A075HLT2_9ARCH|nr:PEBP family protein [uncultured marine thaumarchaeote KM3_73_B11]
MSEFSITCSDFDEGAEIPKKFGYKHGNERPALTLTASKELKAKMKSMAIIMDDPDAMKAVGKVWVHYLRSTEYIQNQEVGTIYYDENENDVMGLNDFGELGYGGPAPPDGQHTYVFKAYALDTVLDLKEGFSKQELEDAMKGHILAEAKLTGTFTT